jgi:hypothetical protein
MDFITDLPPSRDIGATILLMIINRFRKGTILILMYTNEWSAEGTAKAFLRWYVPHY